MTFASRTSYMTIARPCMTHENCIRGVLIQSAPGFVCNGDIAQGSAAFKRERACLRKLVKLTMTSRLIRSPSARGWIRRRVMTVWLVHVSPFAGTKYVYERKTSDLLLRWIAEPHPSPFDEEAPCACHPGCRTNWSLLM